MKKPEYIKFVEIDSVDRKTRIWSIRSERSDEQLGTIAWYSPWRQYCFHPAQQTIFNDGCLTDIVEFVRRQNKTHRESRKERR